MSTFQGIPTACIIVILTSSVAVIELLALQKTAFISHPTSEKYTIPAMLKVTTILFALSLVVLASYGLPVRSLQAKDACLTPAPFLAEAASYSVLAGSTVTNTGNTEVQGDLGVYPGSAVTGFGPGTVSDGAQHKATTAAGKAMESLTALYNDLAGRTCNPETIIGDLGGMTLSPGLYKSTSGMDVTKGDLTLFAKGDAKAIWIFQMATTFNIASGMKIKLTGGARSGNVFWQVGTSGTINTGSSFVGTMVADQAISVKTGATVDGRLLARIAAVTLEGNVITHAIPEHEVVEE